MKWVVATVVLSVFATSQAPLSPPLLRVLADVPGIRLLNPTTDLRGGYTEEELKALGVWPPWVTKDLDGNGRDDLVAVVVHASETATRFGVVAIHDRAPHRLHWVVSLGAEAINGVDSASDVVTPLFCVECDANGWYRWNGDSYEQGLYRRGEEVVIGTYETTQKIPLFIAPRRDTSVVQYLDQCALAIVRGVGGSSRNRWYLIEVTEGGRRGWIPRGSLIEEECDPL